MNLIYRHYQEGDDHQLADLFNNAFHVLIPKTYKGWSWKYTEKPSFDPKSLQICEDEEKHKIVGFIASEVDEFILKGKKIKCGRINDVATDPGYQRNGIAGTLLEMAFSYFDEKKIQFAFLSADPKDHPRKKLYMPNGFSDLLKMAVKLKILDWWQLLTKEAKILLPFLPFVYLSKALVNGLRYFNPKRFGLKKARKKLEPYLNTNSPSKNQAINPSKNKDPKKLPEKVQRELQQYFRAYDQVQEEYLEFLEVRSRENWHWRRIDVPFEDYLGSFVHLKNEKGNIIGGCSFSCHTTKIKLLKTKVEARIGLIHELFMNWEEIKKLSHRLKLKKNEILKLFMEKVADAAKKREISVLIHMYDPLNDITSDCLDAGNYIPIPGGAWMIKPYKREGMVQFDSKGDRPVFIPTYDTIGYP